MPPNPTPPSAEEHAVPNMELDDRAQDSSVVPLVPAGTTPDDLGESEQAEIQFFNRILDETEQAETQLLSKVAQLEESHRALTFERAQLRTELDRARRQLSTLRRQDEAQQRQVQALCLQLSEESSEHRQAVIALEAKCVQSYKNGMNDGIRAQSLPSERAIMLQQMESLKAETAKWRMEAFRQGPVVVSQCWQGSVDEAVRREREKDAWVIASLREEIAALKSENED